MHIFEDAACAAAGGSYGTFVGFGWGEVACSTSSSASDLLAITAGAMLTQGMPVAGLIFLAIGGWVLRTRAPRPKAPPVVPGHVPSSGGL